MSISKLPNIGTNIFSTMSGLATENNAINLAQGFPNFDAPTELKELVSKYLSEGKNQYAPMKGIPSLRSVLANKIFQDYNRQINIDREICITSGASEALFSSIQALVKAGDEVIVLEPCYDLYGPAIVLAGGKVMSYVKKSPHFEVDWNEVKKLISDKTSMIIINTPHNPTGTILNRKDLDALHEITVGTNITILSDEVYEHLVFDNEKHHSILSHDKLKDRSLAVFSFGKTFHCTGWKIGYIVGSDALMEEFYKVHQFNVFSVPHFLQYAIAEYLIDESHYKELSSFYQKKRDLFQALMKNSKLKALPTKGSFFQLYDYAEVSDLDDLAFAKKLTIENGVAGIPISSFYTEKPDKQYIRFCFAKTEDTLIEAANILVNL